MANKFGPLKEYLLNCNKESLSLSFEEIEQMIGTKLCKSAYSYTAYWNPSPTHTMPNTIIAAGYQIEQLDLHAEKIILRKV